MLSSREAEGSFTPHPRGGADRTTREGVYVLIPHGIELGPQLGLRGS